MPTIGEYAVHVRDQSGILHAFTPGEQVPDWAAKQLGAHCFADEPTGATPVPVAPSKTPESTSAPGLSDGEVPPQFGPNAGRDVWAQYATLNGVEIAEDWKRGQIVDACREAGVPVE